MKLRGKGGAWPLYFISYPTRSVSRSNSVLGHATLSAILRLSIVVFLAALLATIPQVKPMDHPRRHHPGYDSPRCHHCRNVNDVLVRCRRIHGYSYGIRLTAGRRRWLGLAAVSALIDMS